MKENNDSPNAKNEEKGKEIQLGRMSSLNSLDLVSKNTTPKLPLVGKIRRKKFRLLREVEDKLSGNEIQRSKNRSKKGNKQKRIVERGGKLENKDNKRVTLTR